MSGPLGRTREANIEGRFVMSPGPEPFVFGGVKVKLFIALDFVDRAIPGVCLILESSQLLRKWEKSHTLS